MKPSNPSDTQKDSKVLGILFIVFLLLAVLFALMPQGSGIPLAEASEINPKDISTAPRFTTMGDDAVTMIEGFNRNCMDCHELIDSKPRSSDLLQHEDIHMAHGLNARCVNCHDPKNRDKLILRDGTSVGFSQSVMLCAQCHGTTYRLWQRGVHGKTLGHWDKSKGTSKKLLCVECHDPHSPRYAPITPLPAPNTLRMGHPHSPSHHDDEADSSPLSLDHRNHHQQQKPSLSSH